MDTTLARANQVFVNIINHLSERPVDNTSVLAIKLVATLKIKQNFLKSINMLMLLLLCCGGNIVAGACGVLLRGLAAHVEATSRVVG